MVKRTVAAFVLGAVAPALLTLSPSAEAVAQALPGPADPGRVEQRFQPVPTPQSAPEIVVPMPEQLPPPDRAKSIRLTLSSVGFDNNTVYSDADLRPLYEPLIGREITLLDLYGLRDAVTAKLRADGYILSQAVLPPQRIQGGAVRLQVVEGYINDVRFEGAPFADRLGLLAGYGDKIKASRPLRLKDLERYVLLVDDLPGVTARTVLQPAPGTNGGSDLIFVLERRPIGASVTLDNRGSRAIGPLQLDGTVEITDQTGLFERTIVRGVVTPANINELRYIDVTEELPVGNEGATVYLGARRTWSEPGGSVSAFQLDSRNSGLRLGGSYPVIRSRSQTLRLNAEFSIRNYITNAQDAPLSEDRLRVFSLGSTYDFADPFGGVNLLHAEVSKGLNVLNASRTGSANLSRAGGRSDFFKVTAGVTHDHPLTDEIRLMAAVEAQWTPHQLLSSEEFGFGGGVWGRGYDPSEVSGDKGIAGRMELQYAPPLEIDALRRSHLYLFVDHGSVWNYEDGPRHGQQSLSSAGAGVRLAINETLGATFELAKPLQRPISSDRGRGLRGFFTISASY